MSIVYHLYSDSGTGSVDYSTILATVSGLSCDPGPLAAPSTTIFAVRAYDSASLAEEANVDARVTVAVSAANADASAIPAPPNGLGVAAQGSGSLKVTWAYNPLGRPNPPAGFHVYAGTPTISYGSPLATVAYNASVFAYSATLSGLSDGATYRVAVRAFNASGEEANAALAVAVASTTGPSPVSGLSAVLL